MRAGHVYLKPTHHRTRWLRRVLVGALTIALLGTGACGLEGEEQDPSADEVGSTRQAATSYLPTPTKLVALTTALQTPIGTKVTLQLGAVTATTAQLTITSQEAATINLRVRPSEYSAVSFPSMLVAVAPKQTKTVQLPITVPAGDSLLNIVAEIDGSKLLGAGLVQGLSLSGTSLKLLPVADLFVKRGIQFKAVQLPVHLMNAPVATPVMPDVGKLLNLPKIVKPGIGDSILTKFAFFSGEALLKTSATDLVAASGWHVKIYEWRSIYNPITKTKIPFPFQIGDTYTGTNGKWLMLIAKTSLTGGAISYAYLPENPFIRFTDLSENVYSWWVGSTISGKHTIDLSATGDMPGLAALTRGAGQLWANLIAADAMPATWSPVTAIYPNTAASTHCPAWSCSTGSKIYLAAIHAQPRVIAHELGHSLMTLTVGQPTGAGGSHSCSDPNQKTGLAYSEGYAGFIGAWGVGEATCGGPETTFTATGPNEREVADFLWDMYDGAGTAPANSETWDTVGFSNTFVVRAGTVNHYNTIQEAIEGYFKAGASATLKTAITTASTNNGL